jgi:3-hydroxybutyryl-CoA dehydrogenase
MMGHAIAAIFVGHGYSVTCCEPSDDVRATLPARVDEVIAAAGLESGPPGQLTLVSEPTKLAPDTLLVIEAAPEVLELKQELLAAVALRCRDAVLATNTSVFCVRDVGALVDDPRRVVGTHWWNPPHLIPLVEVVQGEHTDPAVVHGVIELLASLGKSPVHVQRDTPGFIGNRLQHALWREAMALVQEGICDAQAVDHVVRNSIGLRLSEVGPIENADYVGLDLTLAIHSYVFPALSVAREPLKVLQDLVDAGDVGAKAGRGFLKWPKGKREETTRRLADRIQLLTALPSGPSL